VKDSEIRILDAPPTSIEISAWSARTPEVVTGLATANLCLWCADRRAVSFKLASMSFTSLNRSFVLRPDSLAFLDLTYQTAPMLCTSKHSSPNVIMRIAIRLHTACRYAVLAIAPAPGSCIAWGRPTPFAAHTQVAYPVPCSSVSIDNISLALKCPIGEDDPIRAVRGRPSGL
jgi:hypothetical protein